MDDRPSRSRGSRGEIMMKCGLVGKMIKENRSDVVISL
jgi:hypothetical protein